MHFFIHVDGKTVHGVNAGTTVLGRNGNGTVYTLTATPAENHKALYKGTYIIQRNSQVLDLAELKLTAADDHTNDVALVIIHAPGGAIDLIRNGGDPRRSPTQVLRITNENDGDSWTVLVLEMTGGQRVDVITRGNSAEIIEFDKGLRRCMRETAAH